MSDPYFFDELGSNESYQANTKPIYSFDLDDKANDKDVLNWLKAERDYIESESKDRVRNMRKNLSLYKGIQYQDTEVRTDARTRGDDRTSFIRKIVSNQLYSITKDRVARLVKYRPAVAILPTNDELEDKLAAKMTKMLLDHIWYEQDFEGSLQIALATYALVMGESFLLVDWDSGKGDISPAYLKAKKRAGGRVPLLDENGQQVLDPQGNKVYVDKPVRVGDVVYKPLLADQVLVQCVSRWDLAEYCFTMEPVTTDLLRIQYPDKAAFIKDTDAQIYDYETMTLKSTRRTVYKYTFWHKRCPQLDSGRKIVFIDDCILENVEFPFSHEDLPLVRFTDMDLAGELHGTSLFEQIKGLTGTFNNLTNMFLRNIVMVSHPKWMVPAGSVALDRLGNDITIVQYKGPQPPVLATSQSIPSDAFNFREKIREEFLAIAGVGQVSRGEPPPGIKAGVALQFLSEQEQERYNELALKWNEMIKKVAQMTIAVAGDYYDESDERMIRVLGKNNEYMTEFFKVSTLEKDYDIRIQNSSALPTSKAARTQTLLDLAERFPDQFAGEQVIEMLDLAQNDKFVDAATVAVRSAEAENEKLGEIKDGELLAPVEFENHIIHWKIHTRQMQEFSFKYKTSKEVQERFKDHVIAHEMFMTEHAKKSPMFAKQLEALPLFPMFYFEPVILPPAPEMPMMPPQQGSMIRQGLPAEAGLPVNPAAGGGLPALEPQPSMEAQLGGEGMPPVELTQGI